MPRLLIGFVHRPVGMMRHGFRIVLQSPPEIREITIEVVYRFGLGRVGPHQQHGQRARERLDVVVHVATPVPHESCHARFPAKPREWSFQNFRQHQLLAFENAERAHGWTASPQSSCISVA